MTYDLHPKINVVSSESIQSGYDQVFQKLNEYLIHTKKQIFIFECYPGVDLQEIFEQLVERFTDVRIVCSDDIALDSASVTSMIAEEMTTDRVFGNMSRQTFQDFFPIHELQTMQEDIQNCQNSVIVYGTSASLLCSDPDLLVYFGITRWEIQLRYRAGMSNWKANNPSEDSLKKFKRGYFFEWRLGDRSRHSLFKNINFYVDTSVRGIPKMVSGNLLRACIIKTGQQPFRVVPYFDQSVWGGTMDEVEL